nr:hypothetical protein [Paenibacillus dendritiformis]
MTNICYIGTSIISGSATAVVVATGSETYFGSMASQLTGKAPFTSFDLGVKSITYLLIRFMLIMVRVIFWSADSRRAIGGTPSCSACR